LYQALVNGSCVANQTLDLRGAQGFAVTVSCAANPFNEGESAPGVSIAKTTYTITATACNAASCPAGGLVGNPDYVERKRTATACALAAPASGPC
jgi:MSHA biogenesis protein MshP